MGKKGPKENAKQEATWHDRMKHRFSSNRKKREFLHGTDGGKDGSGKRSGENDAR